MSPALWITKKLLQIPIGLTEEASEVLDPESSSWYGFWVRQVGPCFLHVFVVSHHWTCTKSRLKNTIQNDWQKRLLAISKLFCFSFFAPSQTPNLLDVPVRSIGFDVQTRFSTVKKTHWPRPDVSAPSHLCMVIGGISKPIPWIMMNWSSRIVRLEVQVNQLAQLRSQTRKAEHFSWVTWTNSHQIY